MRSAAVVLIFLPLALALFFLPILDSPQYIPFGFLDFTYESAAVYHTRELIREGSFPTWSVAEWCGVPWVHSMMGVYYPFNWPVYLGAPWPQYFTVQYVLHLALIVIGVFLFLRDFGVGRLCALSAGFALAFGRGMMMRVVGGQASFLESLTWIPWFFWAIERGLVRRELGYFALAGLFNALPVLTLQPDPAIFMGNALAPYLILRAILSTDRKADLIFSLKGGGVYLVAAVLIALAQGIPMFSLMRDSLRTLGAAAYPDPKAGALHPGYMLLYLFPDVFGSPFNQTYWGPISSIWGPYPYIGVPAVLAAVWVMAHPPKEHRAAVRLFTGFSVVSWMIAMGGYTPLYPFLREVLPLFSSWRWTFKFLPFAEFGVCVLAAFGWQEMIRRRQAGIPLIESGVLRRLLWMIPILCVIVPAALWIYQSAIYEQVRPIGKKLIDTMYFDHHRGTAKPVEFYYDLLPKAFASSLSALTDGCLLILITVAFFWRAGTAAGRGRWVWMVLPALVFADLLFVNGKFIRPGRIDHYFPDSKIYGHIRETIGIDRINGFPGAWAIETSLVTGIPDINGGLVFQTADYIDYMKVFEKRIRIEEGAGGTLEGIETVDHPFYHLLGARYLLTESPDPPPGHRLVMAGESPVYRRENYMDLIFDKSGMVYLYENEKRMPRAFLAKKAVVAPREKVLETMSNLGAELRHTVVLEEMPSRTEWPADTGRVQVVAYKSNRVEIDVESASGGMLVLTDRYREGWRLSIDGGEQPVYRADYLFRAAEVGPGKHRVVFWYDPLDVQLGWGFGIAGLVWIGGWLVKDMRRAQPRGERST